MKASTLVGTAVITLGALIMATPALAAKAHMRDAMPRDQSLFYVGIKAGAAAITPDNDDVEYRRTSDDSDASTGVFAGVRIATLPIHGGWPLHLEVGYTDLGKSRVRYRIYNQFCGPYYCDTWLTTRGSEKYAALKQDFVIGRHVTVIGLAGASFNRVHSSTPIGYPELDVSGKHTGLLLGVGGQFNWNNGFSVRAEIVSYGRTSANSDAAGFNVAGVYRF